MKLNSKTIIILILLLSAGVIGNIWYFTQPKQPRGTGSALGGEEKATYEELIKKAFAQKSEGDAGKSEGYTQAIDTLKKAAELSPTDWLPWLNIAVVARLTKEYTLAQSAYDKALAIQPKNDQLYLGKIELYRYELSKNKDEVIDLYEKALEEVPDKTNLIISYAPYLEEVGEYEKSLEYYHTLANLFPAQTAYQDQIRLLEARIRNR